MVQPLLSPTLYLTNMAQTVYKKKKNRDRKQYNIMPEFRQWSILDQTNQILDQVQQDKEKICGENKNCPAMKF